jgi:hypothetical protein
LRCYWFTEVGVKGVVHPTIECLANNNETALQIRTYLAAHEGWQTFVRERLEPRNKLESVFAWQCGRPPTHGGEMMDADVGLFAGGGIDYGSMESSSFSRDVYQRYGVYEEEEDDDNGEAAEWALNLAEVTDPSKLHPIPDITFGDSSESDESEEGSEGSAGSPPTVGPGHLGAVRVPVPNNGAASFEPDLVVVSSPPAGGDDMPDARDDAVVLEDYEAAEGLVDLQRQMAEGLRLGEAGVANGEPGAPTGDNGGSPPEAGAYLSNQYWKSTAFAVDVEEGNEKENS